MSTWDRIEEEVHDWQTSDSEARAQAAFNAALSRARAETLEEAKQRILKRCCSNMVAHGHCEHQPCDYYQNALTEIHALITTPAPATIPVARVREVLRDFGEKFPGNEWCSESIGSVLGVDLDAKGNGHG